MPTNWSRPTRPMLLQIFLMRKCCFAPVPVQNCGDDITVFQQGKSRPSDAPRKPLLEEVKAKIKSINTQEGEAYWLR